MNNWNPDRTRELIQEQGRTRDWVAKQCGIKTQTLTHYLANNGIPGASVMILLARCLNTTVADLLGLTEVKYCEACDLTVRDEFCEDCGNCETCCIDKKICNKRSTLEQFKHECNE